MKEAFRAVYESSGIWGVVMCLVPFVGAVLWVISTIMNAIDDKRKKK